MFTHKMVVVTGGTKGIGKSIVLEFLKRGAQVMAVYSRDHRAAEDLKGHLSQEERNRISFYKGSVEDRDFMRGLFQEIEAKFGNLNVLVNNAGINRDNLFLDMDEDDWNSVMATNLKGTLNMSLLAAELMKKSTEPSYIVNISSISGVFGRAAQANYACSKGAIIGMTKLLAKKFAQDRIFVNVVVPGLIRTDMSKNISQEKIEEIVRATVLKRMGEAEEIAKTVLFLVSGNFSYVSGACIKVDGGYLK